MKTLGPTLLVLGLCLAALPATAQAPQTSYTLKTAENAYWRVDGFSGNNPTLPVPASTAITVTAVNADGNVHNLRIGGEGNEEKALDTPDQEITTTFTSPASGAVEYICTIHATTMKGTFSVGGADGGNGDGEDGGDTPGFGLAGALVALAGLALVLRRR